MASEQAIGSRKDGSGASQGRAGTLLPVRLDDGQLARLEAFQASKRLGSREAALAVLVGLAFETIASPSQPAWSSREVYRSANGDCWSLLHEAGSGRLRVRHVPNLASGGQPSELDVDAFLLTGAGPEHAALRAMIGGLVDPAPHR